jgi:hypothetical protein
VTNGDSGTEHLAYVYEREDERGGGVFNSNDYLRIGWGWKGPAKGGHDVFRIVVGNKRLTIFGKTIHWHFP